MFCVIQKPFITILNSKYDSITSTVKKLISTPIICQNTISCNVFSTLQLLQIHIASQSRCQSCDRLSSPHAELQNKCLKNTKTTVICKIQQISLSPLNSFLYNSLPFWRDTFIWLLPLNSQCSKPTSSQK